MGLAFSRIILKFSEQTTVETQTLKPHKCVCKKTHGKPENTTTGTQTVTTQKVTSGTQTSTKFTEKLTNFGTVDVGSAETFNQACDICELYTEKEAVGYCCVCEQYMCLQCCKHHEKISLCENHKTVGKEDFETFMARNSLFNMQTVPLMKIYLPLCIESHCSKSTNCWHTTVLLASFSVRYLKDTFFLLHPGHILSLFSPQLRAITNTASQVIIKTIQSNDDNKSTTRDIFFVTKGSNEIWKLNIHSTGVFYKKVITVPGQCHGVAAFDNGLAISQYIPTGFSVPDWQIQYLNFEGKMKKQIYYDSDGKPLFKKPVNLVSNDTEDILFVSDSEANTVIALGTKGEVIYKFTHDTIVSPQGIACDEENNVYVTSKNQVIQINFFKQKSRIILGSADKDIIDVYYYKKSRRLAVIEASKAVTIFSFVSH